MVCHIWSDSSRAGLRIVSVTGSHSLCLLGLIYKEYPGFDHIQDIMSTCTITKNGILQKPHHNRDTQVYMNIVIMFFHAGDNVLFSSCCCLSPGQVCVVAVWPDSLAAPRLQMNEEHSGTQRHSWCRSEVILTVMIHTQLGAHGQYVYKTENREALI